MATRTDSEVRLTGTPQDASTLSPGQLRARFLIEPSIANTAIDWVFTDLDRISFATIKPRSAITLDPHPLTGTPGFLDRRELGILNIGGTGSIEVDGATHTLDRFDALYVGRGSSSVTFAADASSTEEYVLISCPAHATHPTTRIRHADAKAVPLGSALTSNERVIHQYIHEGGAQSCQLVLGWTELKPGSVWNTMPPHTHTRRSEIYFYFDLAEQVVMHFLGSPQLTRHVVVRDRQAVLSPPWSIHCGCGTGAYRFLWAMAGENKAFDDMDRVALADLR